MLGFSPLASAPLAGVAASNLMQVIPYRVTGYPVSLIHGYPMVAAVGAYVLSGQTVSFPVTISQEAIYRVLLYGTAAAVYSGFKMITNFTMVAGDDKTLVMYIKDSEGNPVSITGATFKWQAARSYGKASVISKTSSSGIAITDGANGVLTVTLTAANTDSLAGTYVHELEMTLSSIKSTPIVGTMKILPALIEAT